MEGRSVRVRQAKDLLFTGFCLMVTLLALFFLVAIIWSLVRLGLPGINLRLFIAPTPPPGSIGGLSNAIIGSVIITLIAILLAAPIGILIATYLVEFSRKNQFSKVIRFTNDILLSAPSIVMGLFIYALLVKPLGHFSGFAGAIALMMIAIPIITRTTEDILYLVSPLLRESALALGIPRWRVTFSIIYKSALQGIITGILLSLARVMGETAPLLFTSLNNQFTSFNIGHPMASLPIVIYRFAMSPYKNWQHLAWEGALLITVVILAINLFARYLAAKKA
ncbi:MAG: phosphate ABC transporter, permease protein PstA [Legionellaceae bacterium]|nr:phosphate ABC transporter, permease protein PstA [Legionellaceae bacterium]|tara:strand:+ start:249 stop:1088 length:840 start_codon:yes stop_codon:yes gene_type:complete